MQILQARTSKNYLHTNFCTKDTAQGISALCSKFLEIFLIAFTLFCVGFINVVHANFNPEWEAERNTYKKARRALQNHQINQFVNFKDQLTEYPLYQYLVYEELLARISKISDEEIDAFLSTYNDGSLANRLRLKWLSHLKKRNRSDSYLKYYQEDDPIKFKCYFLRIKVKQGYAEDYIKIIRDIWLVGKSQPKSCNPLFKWYEENGHQTIEQVWERFALAMEKNNISLARYLSRKLPNDEQSKAKLWLATHSNPKSKIFTSSLQDDNHINRKIIRHGLHRLAKKDITAAHEAWLALKENYAFGSDLHDDVERSLALRAAYRHDERAKTWMYQLPKDVVDASTGMWRARSALRSLDWELVLRGIAMLNEEEKAESQWQYWKARALSEIGLQSDANELFKRVANERNYYGFLAADQIEVPYKIENNPVIYSEKELQEVMQVSAIVRSEQLLLVNQLPDARREWNFGIKDFTEKQLQIAAALAHNWEWHDYAIRTIAKGNYLDDLSIRFPTPYDELVYKYSQRRKLEPEFVYGIIRRESAFNVQARSPVGARGLMQLMPSTARQVSRQLNLKSPSIYDLYRASFNINLGSTYISEMLKKFNGHRALASAAYNAGPHRVDKWLPENSEMPADVWVDTIPFTETREYVRAILAYTALFEWQRDKNPTRLSVHLQPIPPGPKS